MIADSLFDWSRAPYVVCAWLATYALHSTVMIGGAWLVARTFARRGTLRDRLPALRDRLWKFALVGAIATSSLQTALGFDPWGSGLSLRARAADSSASARANNDGATEFGIADSEAAQFELASIDAPAGTDGPNSAGSTNMQPERSGGTALWIRVLLAVWIAGVAFGLARLASSWRQLVRGLAGRTVLDTGPVHAQLEGLLARARTSRRIRLSLAPGIRSPITFGVWRSEIALPPRVVNELQADEIKALLAHELAHALRRDPSWLCASNLIEIVFFFQPLNRLCARWMSDEAEYLCDDWAVVQIGERVPMAACLTEIACWLVEPQSPRMVAGMAATGSRLSLRVGRLLDEDHDPREARVARWFTPAGVCAAASIALIVPGVAAEARNDDGVAHPNVSVERISSTGDEAALAQPASTNESSVAIALVAPPRVIWVATAAPRSDSENVFAGVEFELARLASELAQRQSTESIDTSLARLRARAADLSRRADAIVARLRALDTTAESVSKEHTRLGENLIQAKD